MTERTSHTIEWLRFPLIAAVVLLHSGWNGVQGEDLYSIICIIFPQGICRIAVPCFFFITGYLFFSGLTTWDFPFWVDKFKKRIRTLLIPYLLWNLIAFVIITLYSRLRCLLNGDIPTSFWSSLADVGGLNMFFAGRDGSPIDYPLWFLRDLIIIVIVSPIIFYFVKKIGFPGVVMLFFLCMPFDLESLFYFTFGAWMRIEGKDPLDIFSKSKWWSYAISAILLVAIALTYREHHLAYEYIKYAFVAAGVCATFCFASMLLDNGLVKVHPWLARASFFVYCSHAVLILHDISNYIVLHLLPGTVGMACVGLFLRAALAIGICLGLYWLMEKLTPRTLALLTGGRKR